MHLFSTQTLPNFPVRSLLRVSIVDIVAWETSHVPGKLIEKRRWNSFAKFWKGRYSPKWTNPQGIPAPLNLVSLIFLCVLFYFERDLKKSSEKHVLTLLVLLSPPAVPAIKLFLSWVSMMGWGGSCNNFYGWVKSGPKFWVGLVGFQKWTKVHLLSIMHTDQQRVSSSECLERPGKKKKMSARVGCFRTH